MAPDRKPNSTDAATIYSTYRFANAVVNGAGMMDYLQGAGMLFAASCTASAGIIGRMTIRSSPSE